MSNPGKETGKEESSEGEADMQDKEILEAAVAQAAEEKSEEKVPRLPHLGMLHYVRKQRCRMCVGVRNVISKMLISSALNDFYKSCCLW